MKKVELSKYGIGVDMSQKKFCGCVKVQFSDSQVKILSTRTFDNTKGGHKAFFEWVKKHSKNKEISCQIVMEVTGVYHENLLYYLYDKGLNVCLEMPKKVKKYLESIGQYSKTDKLDSKGIAQMACERKLKRWKPGSKKIREVRALTRYRKSLIKSGNQFSNQLHAIEHSALEGKEISKSIKSLIKRQQLAIEKIEAETLRIAKEDVEFFAKVKMIADSVPGLGILSVLTIAAETNGFEEFESQKQLQSYAGFDVIENSSGKHEGKTRISKRGNVHLRTAVYMPTVTIVRFKYKPFYSLYERLVKRNGGLKKKAMVAVQRKLLVLVYTLWKKNEEFDSNYEEKKLERLELKLV